MIICICNNISTDELEERHEEVGNKCGKCLKVQRTIDEIQKFSLSFDCGKLHSKAVKTASEESKGEANKNRPL